jgi:hypothetical protein
MQDDIPLGEPLDNRLWIASFPGFFELDPAAADGLLRA